MYLKRRDKLLLLNQKKEFCFTLSAIKTKCPFYIGNLLCFTFIDFTVVMQNWCWLWMVSGLIAVKKNVYSAAKKWKFSVQWTKLPGVAFFFFFALKFGNCCVNFLQVWFQNRRAKWRKREKAQGVRLHAPLGLNNGLVPPPLSAYTSELSSKTHDHDWDGYTPGLPHPTPSFPTLRLPLHPACPQSASLDHLYSPFYTHHSEYYPSVLSRSLLAAAAASSAGYKTPVFKFSPSITSRSSSPPLAPPRSASPVESDRRTSSIAALRLRAKEHSASFTYL